MTDARPDEGLAGRYVVLASVAIGYISVMLAVAPVSIGLPSIAESLGVDVANASWIQIAYLVVLTALVLPAGRIGDIVGFKPVFLAGVAISTVAGAAAAVSTGLLPLVILRGLGGAGAALISGTTLAIITRAFPAGERGRVVGVASVAGAVGAGAGTLLTPVVLGTMGWHGVFWLVVPVGVVSLALGWRMPSVARIVAHRSVDLPGAALLAAGLLTLALSFQHLHPGPETFEAGLPFHLGAQLAAVALLGLFAWREWTAPEPLIRFQYLADLRFGAAVVANGIFHMTMMATLFLTPFLFERAWGRTPLESSLVVTLVQAINVVFAMAAGWLVDKMRWHGLPAASLAGIAVAMLGLGVLGPRLDMGLYVAAAVLLGVSSGVFNTANNTAIMSILPEEARGFSSGMLESTRQFGHTTAVSLGAVALGLAGVSVSGQGSAEAMVAGFSIAEVLMGSIAAVGVAFAAVGVVRSRERAVVLSPADAGCATATEVVGVVALSASVAAAPVPGTAPAAGGASGRATPGP